MSLINDALKRARQNPPQNPPGPFPTLPPAAGRPASAAAWLMPAIVIVLIVAAVLSIGWAMVQRPVQTLVVTPPAPVASAPPSAGQVAAVVKIAPPVAAPPPKPPLLNPSNAPKLQGIFYSPTAPAAIVDGNTVRPGDRLLRYRVAEITKSTVTLAGANGQVIKLSLGH